MVKFPDFIIIGGQRCGTTSLYNYIIHHSEVGSSNQKEIHFFDYNFNKGIEWYKKQFPTVKISGEASPYYIIHPHSPKRIKQLIPNVKLIEDWA